MIGSTHDEDSIFNSLPKDLNASEYESLVLKTFKDIGSAVLMLYPASNFPAPWFAVSAIYRDMSQLCPARRSARWLTEAKMTVYLYWWTHVIDVTKVNPYVGAFHGVEIPFIFDLPSHTIFSSFELNWTPEELILQKNVINYWKNFAQSGDPNIRSLPNWPKYEKSKDLNIVLDTTITTNSGLMKKHCDFWDKFV